MLTIDIQKATQEYWDVIVVGAGKGGNTAGYALARGGLRVLFCEKGQSILNLEGELNGDYAENFLPSPNSPYSENKAILARAGRWWDEIDDQSYLFQHQFVPYIGSSSGGSSALFGMAMERFFPNDFAPLAQFRRHIDTSLPETWPISYADLIPYYEAAESLYRIRGTADNLRVDAASQKLLTPPSLTLPAEALFKHIANKDLHPYQLPMACEYVDGCKCCQGYLCAKNCKNHSGRICLDPAIHLHGASLLDQCEVLRLEADRTKVNGVICRRGNEQFKLRSKLIILSAGALATPAILLKSASKDWLNGLANSSGLVGKNLMRHFIDLYLVDPRCGKIDNRFKELAFNDFYCIDGQKLGTVQSFGQLPPAPIMARSLKDEARFPGLGGLLGLISPITHSIMTKMAENFIALASIVEDPPYLNNRVTVSDNGTIRLRYRIHPQDQSRIKYMRTLVKDALSPYPTYVVKQADNNHRIAHACGTCRFGENPANSVLDRYNRAHDLENLYILDASFFPSSAGTNPALTIAANALRVAEHLLSF